MKIKNSLNVGEWLVGKIMLPKKIPLPISKTGHLSLQESFWQYMIVNIHFENGNEKCHLSIMTLDSCSSYLLFDVHSSDS